MEGRVFRVGWGDGGTGTAGEGQHVQVGDRAGMEHGRSGGRKGGRAECGGRGCRAVGENLALVLPEGGGEDARGPNAL